MAAPTQENRMPELAGQPAQVTFTLTITRAATGEVVTIPMVGHIVAQPPDRAETPTTQPAQE